MAVIAHGRKTFGDGLGELRRRLDAEVGTDVLWHEVAKSRKAPKAVKRCLEAGVDLILVWGGDGTVQRVIDATAGSGVTLGILPAGTANLLAHNLGIPDRPRRGAGRRPPRRSTGPRRGGDQR